eukprot:204055-Rhodomonas_salina.1
MERASMLKHAASLHRLRTWALALVSATHLTSVSPSVHLATDLTSVSPSVRATQHRATPALSAQSDLQRLSDSSRGSSSPTLDPRP